MKEVGRCERCGLTLEEHTPDRVGKVCPGFVLHTHEGPWYNCDKCRAESNYSFKGDFR